MANEDFIKRVQAALGITADGYAGPKTWAAIAERLAPEDEATTARSWIPHHARPILEASFPALAGAEFISVDLVGLMYDGIYKATLPGGKLAYIWTADADIDTDGPGGSKDVDPWWLPETSLRHPNGRSCDSRVFPGIVVPGGWSKRFGIDVGDFGFVIYNGKAVPAQVYDTGPLRKAGEVSLALGRAADIIPARQTAREAATFGNDADDVVYVVLAGSGNRYALAVDEIAGATQIAFGDQWPGKSGVMAA